MRSWSEHWIIIVRKMKGKKLQNTIIRVVFIVSHSKLFMKALLQSSSALQWLNNPAGSLVYYIFICDSTNFGIYIINIVHVISLVIGRCKCQIMCILPNHTQNPTLKRAKIIITYFNEVVSLTMWFRNYIHINTMIT